MGLLLQQALRHGHTDDPDRTADAAAAFRRFVTELPAHGRPTSCAPTPTAPRPARASTTCPWLVLLLADHDPGRALAALRGFYARGGARFLAIGAGLAARELAARPARRGRERGRRRGRRARCPATPWRSIEAGSDLPAHEVNYEQSMVAPLLEILCTARDLAPDRGAIDDAIAAAPAVAARVRRPAAARAPARHRDPPLGRLLVRPRAALGRHLPAPLERPDGQRPDAAPEPVAAFERERGEPPPAMARRIYAANLVDFAPDGSATAAFVFPSCVSGRAAHRADPLANDQDWALYWPLLLGAGSTR